eukprot:gene16271-17913_t
MPLSSAESSSSATSTDNGLPDERLNNFYEEQNNFPSTEILDISDFKHKTFFKSLLKFKKIIQRVPKEKVAISAAESGLSERETQSVEVEITKAASTSTKRKRSKYGDYNEFKQLSLLSGASFMVSVQPPESFLCQNQQ